MPVSNKIISSSSGEWYLKVLFPIAVLIYFITALNSHGYYHADEHYQVVEFAGLKLGTHSPSELTWEYDRGIRSSLLPTICFIVISFLKILRLNDPYSQMAVLRLMTAFLTLSILYFFVKLAGKKLQPSTFRLFVFLSFFLWFIPIINIRFSSESWSGILFLFTLGVLLSESISSKKKYIIAGTLAGLSFVLRFQAAFLIVGLIIWLTFIKKEKIKNIFLMFLSFLSVISLGILLDSWFYNKFILTAWNYFYIFYIETNQDNFGVSPWYYYIWYIFSFPGFPFGIIILFSLVVLMFKKPGNIFIFCVIPFILIHSFVQHKEGRFLFPIVNLIPFIIAKAYEEVKDNRLINNFKNNLILKKISFIILIFLFLMNFAGLAAMAFKSAGIGRMEISRYIYKRYENRPVRILSCQWSSPYNPWQSIPSKFYVTKNITEIRLGTPCELRDSLIVSSSVNLLITRKAELSDNCRSNIENMGFFPELQSIPSWILYLNNFYGGIDEENVIYLYSLQKN